MFGDLSDLVGGNGNKSLSSARTSIHWDILVLAVQYRDDAVNHVTESDEIRCDTSVTFIYVTRTIRIRILAARCFCLQRRG